MSDFSFTSTAQCDYCGNLLSSSDEECNQCDESDRKQQFFRAIGSQQPENVVIESTVDYKWERLADGVGEDWFKYEWLGPRRDVQNLVGTGFFDDVDDVPRRQHPTDVSDEPEVDQNT